MAHASMNITFKMESRQGIKEIIYTCKASRFADIDLLKDSKETIEGLSISTVMLGTIDVGVG